MNRLMCVLSQLLVAVAGQGASGGGTMEAAPPCCEGHVLHELQRAVHLLSGELLTDSVCCRRPAAEEVTNELCNKQLTYCRGTYP